MRHILFLCAATLLGCAGLFSCSRHHDASADRIELAERIMDSMPEKALALLDSIAEPERLPRADYALYCLLGTEAKDKTGQPSRSEERIAVASDYFGARRDYERAVRAYFYHSRVLSDLSDDKRRLTMLLRAEEYMPYSPDDNLKGLICYDIGEVYKSQYLEDEAIAYYEKSMLHFRKAGKVKNEMYALYRIGWAHMTKKDFDEAVTFFDRCLEGSKECGDRTFVSMIYSSLGSAYYWLEDYEASKDAVIKSITMDSSSFNAIGQYKTLGDVYLKANCLDSAKACYNNALLVAEQYKDTVKVAKMQFVLYKVDKRRNDSHGALMWHEKYNELSNVIHERNRNNSIQEIKHMYNNERLQVEKQQLALRNRNLWLVVTILLSITLAVCAVYAIRMRVKERRISQHEAELRNKTIEMNEQRMRLDEQKIRTQQIELENQRVRLEKQSLEAKMRDMELRKQSVCALLLAKVKTAQKINSILKLWSDKRPNNIRFTKAAKKMFDDFIFSKNSWNEISDISGYVITDRFYEKLAEEKKLSPDDIRLSCMIVVGLKTAEISKILDILPNSVSRKRNRLRKKLEDGSDLPLKKLLESWL
ncbi:hypothetical protein [uncultured Alistipes sp.]|uniref:tetratricopeptide repeat protein n=1 Tax=uncultured Alistipes sp. TaxID=538949 RepID=UPI0026195609|nr:hypothetical protein [uncultured Alistipes sp.]